MAYTAALTQTNRPTSASSVITCPPWLFHYDAMSIPIKRVRVHRRALAGLQVTRPATIHCAATFAISNASSNVTVDHFNMVEVPLTGNPCSCINGDPTSSPA